ncbi:MAG: hypothetical protein RLZZ565_332, partial [Planctomycetota bacterium]
RGIDAWRSRRRRPGLAPPICCWRRSSGQVGAIRGPRRPPEPRCLDAQAGRLSRRGMGRPRHLFGGQDRSRALANRWKPWKTDQPANEIAAIHPPRSAKISVVRVGCRPPRVPRKAPRRAPHPLECPRNAGGRSAEARTPHPGLRSMTATPSRMPVRSNPPREERLEAIYLCAKDRKKVRSGIGHRGLGSLRGLATLGSQLQRSGTRPESNPPRGQRSIEPRPLITPRTP